MDLFGIHSEGILDIHQIVSLIDVNTNIEDGSVGIERTICEAISVAAVKN